MPLRLAVLLAASATLAACDFTPTLDIDLPEHQPATVINAVLAVDSVAVVRLGVSTDPYVLNTSRYAEGGNVEGAAVTLLRDGRVVEQLAVRSRTCEDYDYQTGGTITYECGPYTGTVPVEAGGTYTVRAEVPGLPTAEGTVTMPLRPAIAVEEITDAADDRRQFRVRVQDPAGQGDRYGISLLSGERRQTYPICDDDTDPQTCRDVTYVQPREPFYFSSSDPVLLAAARDLDLGDSYFRFLSVTDASFDGRTWTFTVSGYFYSYYGGEDQQDEVVTVQIAALSGDVYDAYQISTFGGQDIENPFIEPVNLPTNVTGGHGLVGGVALAEVTFERESTRRLRAPAGWSSGRAGGASRGRGR